MDVGRGGNQCPLSDGGDLAARCQQRGSHEIDGFAEDESDVGDAAIDNLL